MTASGKIWLWICSLPLVLQPDFQVPVLAPLLSLVIFSDSPCKCDGALQESTGREQEVHDMALAVDSAVHVLPAAIL